MKTLLHIDSSPRAERSHSRQLTARFARAWRQASPDGIVIHRELGLTPVPLISEDWIAAAFSNPANRTPAQSAAIAVSDELVDELMGAEALTHLDAQVPYLKRILGFIGIADISVIYAGSLAGSEEARQSSLDQALTQIQKLVR